MYEIVHSGEYGKIKKSELDHYSTGTAPRPIIIPAGGWRATWDGEGGGVLLEPVPHNLGSVQRICGMPSRVRPSAMWVKWYDIEGGGMMTAYLEFLDGAIGVSVTTHRGRRGTNRFCKGPGTGKAGM